LALQPRLRRPASTTAPSCGGGSSSKAFADAFGLSASGRRGDGGPTKSRLASSAARHPPGRSRG
jgi:hypothetical protein